jgi:hypothetical protein
MTQALYAHMNNKTTKIKKNKNGFLFYQNNYWDFFSKTKQSSPSR